MSHKPRSNTKAIRMYEAYMAGKSAPVAKPVDVYKGVWWTHTEPVNDTRSKKK